jgi:hypothetical protein
MKMKKKVFAGVVFAVAFVMMVGISALALWTNDVISFNNPSQQVDADAVIDNTLYPFVDENGMWGYVNSNGDVVVEAQYEKAEFFLGNIAWVVKDGLWGAVNNKGQQIIECVYQEKYQLDDNLYKICVAVDGSTKSVYNSKGEKIFGIDNGEIGDIDGGLIAFSRVIDGVQHWGYIDTSGKVIIAPAYKSVGNVGLTHAVAQTFEGENVLVKRSDGTETVLKQDVQLDGLGSNMMLYNENDLYGYLDMSGNVAIKAQFIWADSFNNGLALVKTKNGYGLIDETGNYVVPDQYQYAENLDNGYYMFGDSVLGKKTVYNKGGEAVLNDVVSSNGWFNGYLNVETAISTKFISWESGLPAEITMSNSSDAVYYGNRIGVFDINGVTYYDLSGNLLESYGQTFDIGNNCQMTYYKEAPDAYLEISYPEVTTVDENLQSAFDDISARLKENALSDYLDMYKDSDGIINYMVKGDFDYSVIGSVVSIFQKTQIIDEEIDEEYESLCFDFKTGEMYNIASLFLQEVNWRTDLSDLLVAAYKKQCDNLSVNINQDMLAVLTNKLDRNTGFLLEENGMSLYISCQNGSEKVFLTYDELRPFIDQKSEIWLNMNVENQQ